MVERKGGLMVGSANKVALMLHVCSLSHHPLTNPPSQSGVFDTYQDIYRYIVIHIRIYRALSKHAHEKKKSHPSHLECLKMLM